MAAPDWEKLRAAVENQRLQSFPSGQTRIQRTTPYYFRWCMDGIDWEIGFATHDELQAHLRRIGVKGAEPEPEKPRFREFL